MTLPCYFKGPVYKIQLIILQEKQSLICVEFVVSLLDITSPLCVLLPCFLFIGWTGRAVMSSSLPSDRTFDANENTAY